MAVGSSIQPAPASSSRLKRVRWRYLLLLLLALPPLFFVAATWWETGTHLGPLKLDDPAQQELEAMLPSREAMGPDGLYFFANPSLVRQQYGVALSLPSEHARYAHGIVVTKRRGAKAQVQTFQMPSAVYRDIIAKFDGGMDWQMGDYHLCYDGVDTSFERVRGWLITSGRGNCDVARMEATDYLLRAVRPYAASVLPTTTDWHGPSPH